MRLYEIGERYHNLAVLLEDEDMDEEAIVAALESVKDEFGDKARNIARFIQNLKAEEEAIAAEEERLAKRKRAVRNKREGLTTYLLANMLATNITKIPDPVLPISLRKSPPSVEIDPQAQVPDRFLIPQDPKVNKRALLEALKAGEKIPGVRLIDDRKYLKIG